MASARIPLYICITKATKIRYLSYPNWALNALAWYTGEQKSQNSFWFAIVHHLQFSYILVNNNNSNNNNNNNNSDSSNYDNLTMEEISIIYLSL